MNLFKLALIIFIIFDVLISNQNNLFCNHTKKSEKKLKNHKQKITYRLLRNNSIKLAKDRNINPNVYSMLGRFGKKRFPS